MKNIAVVFGECHTHLFASYLAFGEKGKAPLDKNQSAISGLDSHGIEHSAKLFIR
ncbi:MAG TPA: hypothetical protein PLA08_02280 [Candidatus Cloacimonadota bacterium]|nr:hypothetical protein [Candidatus Cloacimonadota bacterium]